MPKLPKLNIEYFFWTPLIVIGLVALGCNNSQPSQSSNTAPTQRATTVIDPNTAGSISGIISFQGPAPKMPMLDLSADPACPPDPQPQDVMVVNNGKLANVFIYVKHGLEKLSFAP